MFQNDPQPKDMFMLGKNFKKLRLGRVQIGLRNESVGTRVLSTCHEIVSPRHHNNYYRSLPRESEYTRGHNRYNNTVVRDVMLLLLLLLFVIRVIRVLTLYKRPNRKHAILYSVRQLITIIIILYLRVVREVSVRVSTNAPETSS